jgi:hypothetical protein
MLQQASVGFPPSLPGFPGMRHILLLKAIPMLTQEQECHLRRLVCPVSLHPAREALYLHQVAAAFPFPHSRRTACLLQICQLGCLSLHQVDFLPTFRSLLQAPLVAFHHLVNQGSNLSQEGQVQYLVRVPLLATFHCLPIHLLLEPMKTDDERATMYPTRIMTVGA